MNQVVLTGEVFEHMNQTGTRKVVLRPAENSSMHVSLLLKSYVFSSRVDFSGYNASFGYQMTSQHPYLCRCFAYEERYQENTFEVLLERLPRSLTSRFSAEEHCPWSQGELMEMLKGLVDALADAQGQNIAHRQICVDHFYCTQENSIKLGNFAPQVRSIAEVVQLAREHENKYRSPELRRLVEGDESAVQDYNPFKSDVYSLGVSFLLIMHWGSEAVSTCLDTAVDGVLETVRAFPDLHNLLSLMLSPDERSRPDFITLKTAGSGRISRMQEAEKKPNLCAFCYKIISQTTFRVDNMLFCDEGCIRSYSNSRLKTGILHYQATSPWADSGSVDNPQAERPTNTILQENLKRENAEIAQKLTAAQLSAQSPGVKRQKLLVSRAVEEQIEDKTCKRCGKGLKLPSEVTLRLCKHCELNKEPKETGQLSRPTAQPEPVSEPLKLCRKCREPLPQGHRNDTCQKCAPVFPPNLQSQAVSSSDSKPKESRDSSLRKPAENAFPSAPLEAPRTGPSQNPRAVEKGAGSTNPLLRNTGDASQPQSRPRNEGENPSIPVQKPVPQSGLDPAMPRDCLICHKPFTISAVPDSWRTTARQEFPTHGKSVDYICSNDCLQKVMQSPVQRALPRRPPPESMDPQVSQVSDTKDDSSATARCIVCFRDFHPRPVERPDFGADVLSFCSEKCTLDYINQQEDYALEATADENTVRCMQCAKVVRSSPEKLPCSPDTHQFCSLTCAKEFLDNVIVLHGDLGFALCPSCDAPIPSEVSQRWREVQRLVPDADQEREAAGVRFAPGRFPGMREE